MASLEYPDVPLHALLRRTAGAHPQRVAISFRDRAVTFSQLEADSNRLAHALIALGVEPGDRVGLFATNCPEFEVAFYAAIKAGAVACPINPSYRERELAHVVNDASIATLVTHTTLTGVVDSARALTPSLSRVIVIGGTPDDEYILEELMAGAPETPPDITVDSDSLAVLPY